MTTHTGSEGQGSVRLVRVSEWEGAGPILDPWPGTRLVRSPLVVSRQRVERDPLA